MKLELGAAHRGTRGYVHNDAVPFDGVDIVAKAWDIDLPDGSVDEVLALAFIEHLTFFEALDTFRNVHRMLKPGGVFLFDVPLYRVWARYYLDSLDGVETPFPIEHIRKTLFGWQRWPGDEHKWGWEWLELLDELNDIGFAESIDWNVNPFIDRVYRRRFHNPDDAHIYVVAVK